MQAIRFSLGQAKSFKINLRQVAYRMCHERLLKVRRDTRMAKRRARRLRQLHDFFAYPVFPVPAELPPLSSDSEDSLDLDSLIPESVAEMAEMPESKQSPSQTEHLQMVANDTIRLMYQNEEIQRKLEELRRETAEFIASVVAKPENRHRFGHCLVTPTPFQTPPSSVQTFSDTSSSFGSPEDSRSLPDLEGADANDAYDVEIRDFKQENEY